MTSIFVKGLKKEARKTKTENGANAFNTTKNGLVDLFAIIGGMREQDVSRLHLHIDAAYNENPLLLAKMLFQTRDIRGGLGERDIFRESINYCAKKYPDIITPNIAHIPEYGRWDDMFALIGTSLERDMFTVVRHQLDADLLNVNNNKNDVSLLAKWLPTADASSEKTRAFAKVVAKGLGFKNIREYKDTYKPIRKYLNTVESLMSAKKWSEIVYETVPSCSMLKHSCAFYKNDGGRYDEYLRDVRGGEKTIHASTLYPYDIIGKVFRGEKGDTVNLLWNALPNYVTEEKNYLVMADVSGSMSGRPMFTSIGLATYFAQRNKGAYHNCFMTFSANPQIQTITEGGSISDIVRTMMNADWQTNTDLERAFDKILEVAIKNKCEQKDLPEALIIITDMEFDAATSNRDVSFMKAMREKFKSHGYKIPNIVFWNVDSRHDTYHTSSDKESIVMVSGQSVSTFKNLMGGLNGKTAYDIMVETLNDKRYDLITVENL